jgi:flagellar hook-length control protein FliK
MTSAITRAPAGAAHAHGFAKSLKGDAPAEGFEALFAAVAGAQPAPAMPPVVGDAVGKGAEHGKAGEGAADDERASSQAFLIAASMALVSPDTKIIDQGAVPAAANSQAGAIAQTAASRVSALENTNVASTLQATTPAPASQRIVPNAAFAILEPVPHALIAHKGRVAETPVPPTVDPPRIARAPLQQLAETMASTAKQTPAPVGAPVPSHAEAETVSPAPPSSHSTQAPAERTRTALSPRALVQAVMVEVVRSPGRNRTAPSEAANVDTQDTTAPQSQAASSSKSPIAAATAAISAAEPAPVASAPVATAAVPLPPIVEQAVLADAAPAITQPVVAPKPAPASRAAADIARQRQFVLASTETPAAADATEASAPAFDALIAMRKADGTLDSRAPSAPSTESISPAAPSGAWLGNLPASTTQALNATATAAMPRAFDQAAWSAALAQQVTASAIAATRETTVRIKPDGLGPIEVRVSVQSQHVDVRFAIEHPVTVNMVREALPDLQRMLAQSGLNLGDAQVAQQNAGHRGQAARGDASASRTSEDEGATSIDAVVETRPRARVGLLDDFV